MIRESNGFSLPASYLDDELRFDAGHFNPSLLRVLDELSNTDTVRLGEIAEVFMPNRFKRVYVEPEYGLPFLQGSHVIQFQATGLKYLSREYDGIDNLFVKAGWLLVTRSGTVGRVTVCPDEWDGWPATEDIIRVVPDAKQCPCRIPVFFLGFAARSGAVDFPDARGGRRSFDGRPSAEHPDSLARFPHHPQD